MLFQPSVMPSSITTSETIIGAVAKESLLASTQRRSYDNAVFYARASSELPNGHAGPTANGLKTANNSAATTAPPDGSLPAVDSAGGRPPKIRPASNDNFYSRDLARSRDESSSVSNGGLPDGLDNAKRGSRPTSASAKAPLGAGEVSSTMRNGGPPGPNVPPQADADGSLNSASSAAAATATTTASGPRSDAVYTAIALEAVGAPLSSSLTSSQANPSTPHPLGHRLSSPPAFHMPSPAAASGTTAASPQSSSVFSAPQASPPVLRHRHTLQVPKAPPPPNARSSRELPFHHTNMSGDVTAATTAAASASGRFSFTTPGTRRASLTLGRRMTHSLHSDLHVDDVPQDDDAARWTEAIRQKRTSRRKRKEEEDDGRVVVGTKVDQNHVNWVTAYNMLTGIRFTVSRTNAKLDRPLTDADFNAKHKFSFDITGNELTPSAKYDFKFKDYAPWVFRHLRASFGLDPGDYLMSLTSKYILSELGSPGKSGSFFYFSRDYKYIIKTIHHSEHKVLRRILHDYYRHVQDNPNTLLSQFYGLHRVKIPYGKKTHFVVMNNLFPPHRDIHQTFDLKGSTIGRDFTEGDLAHNPRATLKDLNWLRRGMHLQLGPAKREVFLTQVRRDVQLLQRLNIMDYSLLVGIHDLGRGNDEGLRDKTLQVFQPGGEHAEEPPDTAAIVRSPSTLENARKARELRQMIKREKPIRMDQSNSRMPDELLQDRSRFTFYGDDGGFRATHEDDRPGEVIYYLGIIDCLTNYGTTKKVEHFLKGLHYPKSQISPIAPEGYGERFVRFITGVTKSIEEAEREKKTQMGGDGNGSGFIVGEAAGDGAVTSEKDRRVSAASAVAPFPPPARSATDRVMEKAERQARLTERDGAVETDKYDRTLIAPLNVLPSASGSATVTTAATTVVFSTTNDNGVVDGGGSSSGAAHNSMLPIVDEVGEGGSTSGRSRDEDDLANATANATTLTTTTTTNTIITITDNTVHPANNHRDYDNSASFNNPHTIACFGSSAHPTLYSSPVSSSSSTSTHMIPKNTTTAANATTMHSTDAARNTRPPAATTTSSSSLPSSSAFYPPSSKAVPPPPSSAAAPSATTYAAAAPPPPPPTVPPPPPPSSALRVVPATMAAATNNTGLPAAAVPVPSASSSASSSSSSSPPPSSSATASTIATAAAAPRRTKMAVVEPEAFKVSVAAVSS